MTTRLYLADSTRTEFIATVEEKKTIDGRTAVRLDQTAFYPTSGGQMNDRGWIDDIAVDDVRLLDGEIWHLVEKTLPETDTVHCRIDWDRRFDFMQQHTAFHLLAGAFKHAFDFETLSSHLGEEFSTIDVDCADLSEQQIDRIEVVANQVVWEDRSVSARFCPVHQLAELNLRKKTDLQDSIRLVEIAEWDLDPCGGTHVSSTGQVGMIKIMGKERIRGSMRLRFYAGKRCLRLIQQQTAILSDLSRQLTTGVADLPLVVEKNLEEANRAQKRIQSLQQLLLDFWTNDIVLQAQSSAVVVRVTGDLGPEQLRALASSAMKKSDAVFILAGVQERTALVVASGRSDIDLEPHFRRLAERIGAKGGGRNNFFQASTPAPSADLQALLEKTANEVLSSGIKT
ncbi:hypothetical protein JW992_10520 [candidate division KSB1 bacterium]|nr:hypothetical protein [candidate division KSB1 bacterium]